MGVYVCKEWRESYDAFEHWAICAGYSQDKSLDRIRQQGPYSPANCRWVTTKQQAYNRATNRYLTVDGHRRTMQEWSDMYGVPKWTINRRLGRGWSEEDAVKIPPGGKR